MKFMFLLSSVWLMVPSFATPRNLREPGRGDSNKRTDEDRPRPPFAEDWEPEYVTIGCDSSLECDLRNGQAGSFVCRSWTHPILGDAQFRPLCVPNDRAWTTDECGCCLDEAGVELECPLRPDFTTLQCDNSTQPDLPDDAVLSQVDRQVDHQVDRASTDNNFAREDRQVICRDLVNPFTGANQPTTLFAPNNRAVEGDTCGCCESTGCPERGENGRDPEELFPRPDFIEKSCAADVNYIPCDLRPVQEEDGGGNGTSTQGFFACREFYDPRGLGESRQEAVCISESRAWETDECGCCGEDCPERPRAVDVDCSIDATGNDHSCDMQSGEAGVFVCRTIFHPFDGQLRERGFCIPANRGWVTDVCGCCEEGCPTTPGDGFDTEATQLAVLAMEVPEDYGIDSTAATMMVGDSGAMGRSAAEMLCGALIAMVMIFSA
jgi:hypothetical protein